MPIVNWSLKRWGADGVSGEWVDFSRIPLASKADRLRKALDLYPCDVLFFHRDAESQSTELRRREIAEALRQHSIRHVPVIPVRMTEAWLLFDEAAIRRAASNPNGSEQLGLPGLAKLEKLPNPKVVLHDALLRACGLNKRRRSRVPLPEWVHRIPSYIDDFSALDALPSFRALQDDIRNLIAAM
jgi:hypothetical protein